LEATEGDPFTGEVWTQNETEIARIKGIDSLSTVLSNDTWTLVFNKTLTPGWGLAEERWQRVVRIGFIAEIAGIGKPLIWKPL